jgi:hypothetical protein
MTTPMQTCDSVSLRSAYQVLTSWRTLCGAIVPTLKVIRLSDKALIYPFEGCPAMPLFDSPREAIAFAEKYGWQLVDSDIAVPESTQSRVAQTLS